jgi:hypothetical protein
MTARWLKTSAVCAAILAAGVTPSAAYYHYVHYLSSSSPYSVIFEKFDLTALPDKTVTFFVSDNGPNNYTPNDSFPSVLAQIRNATQVWNAVASSDLRVAFGGLQIPLNPQSVPTGEIVFEEMPPGVLAFAGHAVSTNIATAADGTQFVPITAALIHLNIDLAQPPGSGDAEGFPGPSYSETFFTTVVHEIGHCLGLQHTYTASAMSTAVSRATNRAKPLDVDDVAGISLLYPRGGFPAGYGSISGQVTMNGNGVHLASVVAIQPNGSSIGSLTLPDGTYEIDGLQPGSYYVYVHPLPPTANISGPFDVNSNLVPASAPFVSTFSGGTWNPSQFTPIAVAQGAPFPGVDFSVAPRSAVEVYDVTSYWYGTAYNQPAYLNANTAIQTVVAQGDGITSGTNSTPVQSVIALGAPGGPLPDYSQQVYQDSDIVLLAMYFDYPSTPAAGPEQLLFTLPDDIFVLPQAIQIVQNPPPSITAVTPNADGSVTVTGTGMSAASGVFFDSLPGQVAVPYAAGSRSGSVSLTPPPGASGQTATITVYNPDGQNSTFLPSPNPVTYTYPQTSAPSANISLGALQQGVSAMAEVTTANMQFVQDQTTLGFGSGDVTVRQLWVVDPSLCHQPAASCLWANVTVSPSALLRTTVASVISGFQVYEQSPGFLVMPADPNMPAIALPVPNAFYPVQNSLYPGAIASIYGQNLVTPSGPLTLLVGGRPVQILYSSATQINFVIPVGLSPGPVVLALNNGQESAHSVVLQIDPPPPVILGAASATGVALNAAQSAVSGSTIALTVSGMDPAVVSAPARVGVVEGGVSIPAFTVSQAQDGSGNLLIQFALAASVMGQQVPVAVTQDGDLGMPFYINVVAPAASATTTPGPTHWR